MSEPSCFLTTTQLAAAIRGGRVTCREALEAAVARNAAVGGALNAIVVLDLARARARADALDEAARRGEWVGPLHGVPITVKECNDVAGLPTTLGDPENVGSLAPESEVMCARVAAAGAVIWGKSNLPLNAMDIQSYNAVYGSTSNPWSMGHTPGGSSGGGAAAVAAGITSFELGSDVGGSIRTPAAFCGIYGHKPTFGLVPKQGPSIELHPKEISVRGPLARSAEDLALVLECIAGPTERGYRLELPRPTKARLADFRIAVWADEAAHRVDDELSLAAEAVAQACERCGATVDRAARPDFDIEANVRCYQELTAANEALSSGKEGEVSLLRWRLAKEKQQEIRASWARFFLEFDVVIVPSHSTPAFLKDEGSRNGREIAVTVDGVESKMGYWKALFWAVLTNVGLLPSTTFPCGVGRKSGLPLGLNAVGPEWSDLVTIDFARLLKVEAGFGGFEWPPGYGPALVSRL